MEKPLCMQYATHMNNQEWYSKVIQFCQLSVDCKHCPFSLLNGSKEAVSGTERPCFSTKEALVALETWLAQSREEETMQERDSDDDNQWLKDLLKVQFHEDDDEDDFFTDEQFI